MIMIEDSPVHSFNFLKEDLDSIYLDVSRTFYLEGKEAMKDGTVVQDCPYEDETKSTLWKMGWQSATIE